MLVRTLKSLIKNPQTSLQSISHPLMPAISFSVANNKLLNTQVFSDLPYSKLADPHYTKALIIKPIHNHSRVSQRSLFHEKRVSGKIKTCFSEKKYAIGLFLGIKYSEEFIRLKDSFRARFWARKFLLLFLVKLKKL